MRQTSRPRGKYHRYKTMSEFIILTFLRLRSMIPDHQGVTQLYHDDLDAALTLINFVLPSVPLPRYWKRDKAQMAMSKLYQQARRHRRIGHEHGMLTTLQGQKYRDDQALADRGILH